MTLLDDRTPPLFEIGEPVKYIDQPVRPLQEPERSGLQWGVITSRSWFPRSFGLIPADGKECWHYAFGPGVSLWYEERFIQKLSLLERLAWESQ